MPNFGPVAAVPTPTALLWSPTSLPQKETAHVTTNWGMLERQLVNSQGVVVSRHGTYTLVHTIRTLFLYSFLATFCSHLHASIIAILHPYLAKVGYTYLISLHYIMHLQGFI